MNTWLIPTKVFAFFLMLLTIFTSASAQSASSVYQLPSGTKIRVRMDNEISSRVSSANDTFTVVISAPVKIGEFVVLPIGTVIVGRVIKANRASFSRRNGSLEVLFETLRLENGETRKIEGILVERLNIESAHAADALTIFGGTALGAIVGAVLRAENGVLIGSGIGAGAGIGATFLRKGRDVRIKTAQKFEIKLTKSVDLPVRDY